MIRPAEVRRRFDALEFQLGVLGTEKGGGFVIDAARGDVKVTRQRAFLQREILRGDRPQIGKFAVSPGYV